MEGLKVIIDLEWLWWMEASKMIYRQGGGGERGMWCRSFIFSGCVEPSTSFIINKTPMASTTSFLCTRN